MKTGALFDGPDYRYWLFREWAKGTTCLFVMLNPSTADAITNDATIRRCISYARREGHGRLEVVNLFGYRSTDPKKLLSVGDPVGAHNDKHVRQAIRTANQVILAWGCKGTRHRASKIGRFLDKAGKVGYCFGSCLNGHPLHPLRLSTDAPLKVWEGVR